MGRGMVSRSSRRALATAHNVGAPIAKRLCGGGISNLIAEIKPAIETFTGAEFHLPSRRDVDEGCREYDRFEWVLRDLITYMAHLRHGGFPSPLLDWTRSPYVAAHFAFSRARHEGDVAIYAYRERPNNMKIGGSDSPRSLALDR